MNTHKNARLTFARRLEMVQEITEFGSSVPQAAADHGVTAPTVRKWLGRYLAGGVPALADASSRPERSPRSIAPATALLIVELRQQRLLQRQIARQAGVSALTVSRALARAGLSRLSDLQPREPVQRYEHEAPGDLLHIDIKKLGRIARPSHRVTGNRRDTVTAWVGSTCSSPWTTMPGLPSRRCIPTRRNAVPCSSCVTPLRGTPGSACMCAGY